MRKQNSVRDIKEGGSIPDKPQQVTAPAWLSPAARTQFQELVVSLTAADVPIKQVDCYCIAMAAQCVTSIGIWSQREQAADNLKDQIKCSNLVARYQRDSQNWLNAICATPTARARVGIKSTAKKEGPLAKLLQQKQANARH